MLARGVDYGTGKPFGVIVLVVQKEDIVVAINTDYTPTTESKVYSLANFPMTNAQGNQVFADLYDIGELLNTLPE